MREVRETRLKLQRLKNNLLRTDQSKVMSDLAIFWKFIRGDPFVRPIVAELDDFDFDFDRWEAESRESRGYSFPHDERDRAAMCLAILNPDKYNSEREIWSLALSMYLTSENNIAKMTQSFFDAFLPPLFDYIDERLLVREAMVSASDVMLDIQGALQPAKLTSYPKTAAALETAYRKLNSESGSVVWQNIGNSCRASMIAFASEVYQQDMATPDAPQPKGGDARQKIVLTLRHYWKRKHARGRYLDAVESSIQSTWDMASALVHRNDATEADAKGCVMYTYLAVWTVATVIAASPDDR